MLHVIQFSRFQVCADDLDLFSVNVIFNAEVDLLLLPELDYLLVPAVLVVELHGDETVHVVQLLLMLCFQLLYKLKSCCLVVSHVPVPGLRKFLIL